MARLDLHRERERQRPGGDGRGTLGLARWTVIFPDLTALRGTTASAPISNAPTVWTGCDLRGLSVVGTDTNCGSWTTSASLGNYGFASETAMGWSAAGQQSCTDAAPIYCFEDAP